MKPFKVVVAEKPEGDLILKVRFFISFQVQILVCVFVTHAWKAMM